MQVKLLLFVLIKCLFTKVFLSSDFNRVSTPSLLCSLLLDSLLCSHTLLVWSPLSLWTYATLAAVS
jgi:hypothetical protein